MDSIQTAEPNSRKTGLEPGPGAVDSSKRYVLSNQQMSSTLSTTGAGGIRYKDWAITRWRDDPTSDTDGNFLYLRDLDTGRYWSAGYQPTLRMPTVYEVRLRGSAIEFLRCDFDIRSTLRICVAEDANVELRSCTLTNQGRTPRRLELTSYSELVLYDAPADAAHPAFSKLFVETGLLCPGVLTARRRQRQADEVVVCAAHFLAGNDRPDEYETDRGRFIGRGQDLSCPRAMQSPQPLSGTVGSVLDPIFSLRKTVLLAPGASASVVFGLGASRDASEPGDWVARFADPGMVEKTFQAASDTSRQPRLLASDARKWRIDSGAKVRRSDAASHSVAFGAPSELEGQSTVGEKNLSQAKPDGSTDREYAPASLSADDRLPVASGPDRATVDREQANAEVLQFDNGWGGFSADGKEYVMRVGPSARNSVDRPPLPWVNIIANPNLGFIVSESGAGMTWSGNSRLNRLTPWHNDPICDPHSEAIYIRDDQQGVFWSPTPGPVRQQGSYEVRHGFGYTKFLHTSHDFRHELVQFVPPEDAVKITCLRLQNLSSRTRRVSLFSYHQWELGDGSRRQPVKTTICREQQAIFATNKQRAEFSTHTAYAALILPEAVRSPEEADGALHFSADRREFLGSNGRLSNPRALRSHQGLSGNAGDLCDSCAACQATVEIPPGGTLEAIVLLGESPQAEQAQSVLRRYRTTRQCQAALHEVRQSWRDRLGAVQIETPAPAIDLLVNGWLAYQNLSCRLWGRSSTYQSGGAYGFRDQLQDAAALVHHWPALTRKQILRNAAHQFTEGDVLHWWHPPLSQGIRTIFSDDLLWLPLLAAEYVTTTGDESLWHEQVRFVTGPFVPDDAAEVMLVAHDSGESATVYEHCCRALDRGLTVGQHGLPLMGCGDWNDGMNRVGQNGRGESVWLGFFIDTILGQMLPVCQQFEDFERFQRYQDYRHRLRASLNEAGWDGAWYRRGYFDDGTPLGTAESPECKIDALVQAWAVLSGAAPKDRAVEAMAAAEARLVDQQAGLIRLLDPPFDQLPQDPGYIKGYLPGIRENGGQYTHGVLWFIRAIAELGHGSRAVELLGMLSPVNHTRTFDEVNVYQGEPYVVAADVYSQPPHVGRCGWSWYTGSAGWMWRVAVESILGVGLRGGDTLRIDPRISADWPECRVRYRLEDRQTVYDLLIRNPHRRQCEVTECELDGKPLPVEDAIAWVPLAKDGKRHRVIVTL